MNLENIELNNRERMIRWLKRRLSGTYALDTRLWRFAVVALWLISCVAVGVTALGMPTGFGVLPDIITGVSINTIAFALSSAIVAILLAIVGLRIPRFTMGSLLYVGVLAYFIFYFSEFGIKGSVIFAALFALSAAVVGLLVGLIASAWVRKSTRIGVAAVAGTMVLVMAIYAVPNDDRARHADSDSLTTREVHALTSVRLADPSLPGDYAYDYFTYGSGDDRHRAEFGEEVDLISSSIDASALISEWPWLRDKFWGFDQTELPLNGRVWMPEGEGPFPLVLMVHGNHLMEKFSDEGYGYLGELLASRGIAAVSIDENFLNYSVWSGIPEEDMEARAWMLLKHIQQIQKFSQQADSPFYDRIDFKQLALLGHSRGGQAVAMAADRDLWFAGDEAALLPDADTYSVQSVIAIAPTDTVVDGKKTQLQDISYLTLQGAKDSDLINFYGDRQYRRVSFSSQSDEFKTSLYIEDANHSQFNTEWGEFDNALPAGLFIHPEAILEGEKQRQIAKVYVAAFLETVFHGDEQYESLFLDYREGLHFLPSTRYFSQYESSLTRRIADFEGADRSALSPGVTAEAVNMTDWRHEAALDRQGEGKGNQAVTLKWDEEGSYTVHLDKNIIRLSDEDDDVLLFSMANREASSDSALSIDIEVTDDSGVSVTLPLEQFMTAQPLPVTDFTWLPGMETVLSGGKFDDSLETVFQTYELPMSEFEDKEPRFDPSELTELTFHFKKGPGQVMLDDIGVMTE